MLIQVDVDSTLYPSDKLFKRVAKEEFGLDWPEPYYFWFGPDHLGTDLATLKNLFKKCHSREYVMQNEPYPAAAEVLTSLVKYNDDLEIAYVSDRNQAQTGALRDWLDKCGFLPDEDTFVAATSDKREWMRERLPEIVIDDRVRTLLFARYELGAQCVTLEHPHNVNLKGEAEGIYLCEDWHEIYDVVANNLIPAIMEKK